MSDWLAGWMAGWLSGWLTGLNCCCCCFCCWRDYLLIIYSHTITKYYLPLFVSLSLSIFNLFLCCAVAAKFTQEKKTQSNWERRKREWKQWRENIHGYKISIRHTFNCRYERMTTTETVLRVLFFGCYFIVVVIVVVIQLYGMLTWVKYVCLKINNHTVNKKKRCENELMLTKPQSRNINKPPSKMWKHIHAKSSYEKNMTTQNLVFVVRCCWRFFYCYFWVDFLSVMLVRFNVFPLYSIFLSIYDLYVIHCKTCVRYFFFHWNYFHFISHMI